MHLGTSTHVALKRVQIFENISTKSERHEVVREAKLLRKDLSLCVYACAYVYNTHIHIHTCYICIHIYIYIYIYIESMHVRLFSRYYITLRGFKSHDVVTPASGTPKFYLHITSFQAS